MIDVDSELLIPMAQVPAEVERISGRRPHRATVERWQRRGVRSIRLDTCVVGGGRYSSREAIYRFIQAVTAAADKNMPVSTTTPTIEHTEVTAAARCGNPRASEVTPSEPAIDQAGLYLDGEGI